MKSRGDEKIPCAVCGKQITYKTAFVRDGKMMCHECIKKVWENEVGGFLASNDIMGCKVK